MLLMLLLLRYWQTLHHVYTDTCHNSTLRLFPELSGHKRQFRGFGSSLRDVGRVFLCSSNRKHSEGCEVLNFHGKHL